MKTRRCFALLLALMLVLTGCAANAAEEEEEPSGDTAGADWRTWGWVNDAGTLTRDGEEIDVLVCVFTDSIMLYLDDETQRSLARRSTRKRWRTRARRMSACHWMIRTATATATCAPCLLAQAARGRCAAGSGTRKAARSSASQTAKDKHPEKRRCADKVPASLFFCARKAKAKERPKKFLRQFCTIL